MATYTFYLRPNEDVSLEHPYSPASTLSAGYQAISEEVCDFNSTYLSHVSPYGDDNSSTLTSVFVFSGDVPSDSPKVTAARVGFTVEDSGTNNLAFDVNVGGVSYNSGTLYPENFDKELVGFSDYYIGETEIDGLAGAIDEYVLNSKADSTLNLQVGYTTTATRYSGMAKSETSSIHTSQLYIAIDYETDDIGVHRKVGGAWEPAKAAYQKRSGAWVEIAAAEFKAALQGRFAHRTVTLRNLVADGSFENVASNWTTWLAEPTDTAHARDGAQSLKLGGDSLASNYASQVTPVVGHKYYGREYIKTAGELDAADCRFELMANGVESSLVFGWNRGDYPDWTPISGIVTAESIADATYSVRTFTVGGTCDAWVDSIVVIDLTEAFGAGNEPDKAWCDENIPYFEGRLDFDPRTKLVNMLPAVNGSDGFNAGTASSAHVRYADSALMLTGSGDSVESGAVSFASFPLDPAHLYYARAEIYQDAVCGSADFYWPIAEPAFYDSVQARAGEWTMASAVTRRDSFSAGSYQVRIDFNNLYAEASMWFDGLMLIDLTAAFGAGNEPDKAWCDENIPYFTGAMRLRP